MRSVILAIIAFFSCLSGYSQVCDYDDIYAPCGENSDKNEVLQTANRLPADTIGLNDSVRYLIIPTRLRINDKIILVNRSQYTILQAAVVLLNDDGTTTPLGSASLVLPGWSFQVASFENNWLRKLRGKTIGIKIKGAKTVLTNEIENLDPAIITYDFTSTLSENDHDLYITVTSDEGVLDF